jgi:hypothetical protein
MNSKRLNWLFMGSLVLMVIGLIASAYQVNTMLSKEAAHVTDLKAKSLALTKEQDILNNAKLDLAKYSSLNQIAKAVVPQDKNQADAVREIVNIAQANGISLAAINFPASTLGSTTSSSSSTAFSTSQLIAVANITGVYQLTITVIGDSNKPVPYDKFISFLSALEHNRRTAQVSTMTIQPSSTDKNLLTFTLTLNEYIKP